MKKGYIIDKVWFWLTIKNGWWKSQLRIGMGRGPTYFQTSSTNWNWSPRSLWTKKNMREAGSIFDIFPPRSRCFSSSKSLPCRISEGRSWCQLVGVIVMRIWFQNIRKSMGNTVSNNNKHVRRTIWTIWIIDAMDPMDMSIISHGSLTSDHGYGPFGPFHAQPRHLQPAAAPWTFQDRATHGISAMESIEKMDSDTPWNPQKLDLDDLDDLDDLEGGRSFWGMRFVHVPPEISTNMRSPINPKWLTPCPVRTGQPRAAGWRGDVIDKIGPFSSTASPGPRALLAISMASEDRRPRCGLSAKATQLLKPITWKNQGRNQLNLGLFVRNVSGWYLKKHIVDK